MTPPVVSVVMANFRGAAHLARAMTSVLAQSERRLELILSDDASDDDSLAIARRIARRIGGDITIGDPGRNPQPDNELGGAILIARLPGILSPETDTDGAGG